MDINQIDSTQICLDCTLDDNLRNISDEKENVSQLLNDQGEILDGSTNDSDLSLPLSLDLEVDLITNSIGEDELPAFEIRLISPHGRSPSPIYNIEFNTSKLQHEKQDNFAFNNCQINHPDYVALHEINAQITPPNNTHNNIDNVIVSRTNSLETIYEGVFLNTPPRQRHFVQYKHGLNPTCISTLEKCVLKRQCNDKENQSPTIIPNDLNSNFSS